MTGIIIPTVGRVVLYNPGPDDPGGKSSQPHAATIAYVWDDRKVNLAINNSDGRPYNRQSVTLIQSDVDEKVDCTGCAEWMPYQKGQAAKTEELEKQLETE